jgi:HSP20 family protein
MSSLVPFGRNKNREGLTPYGIMRSFLQDPFFGDFGITPFIASWGGVRADVKDMGSEYVVEAELPGIAKEKINLDIHDGMLTISANEEAEQKEEKNDYVYRERRWGHVSRSFSLENINENAITAEHKDGLLFVHMPKAEPEKKSAKKIDIH